jgi:16S rRNA (uracil1498-N3)-methyltransferase
VGAGPADVAATAHTYLDRLDDRVVVDGDDGHHLVRVRRVRPGEVVTGADGYGRWRAYDVAAVERGAVELRATSDLLHEPPLVPRLTVACALTKGEKPELVVQKLTELAADTILLVVTARSVVRWDGAREAKAMERMQRVAREAGAQSRRARLPVIEGPLPVSELVGRSGLVVADRDGLGPDEVPAPRGGEWVVAVGPEGGFDDDELASFGEAPRLALGEYVLRAETAALAAASALAWRRSR